MVNKFIYFTPNAVFCCKFSLQTKKSSCRTCIIYHAPERKELHLESQAFHTFIVKLTFSMYYVFRNFMSLYQTKQGCILSPYQGYGLFMMS